MTESKDTRRPYHSFVTRPAKGMVASVAISESKGSIAVARSKFKFSKNPIEEL